MMMSSEMHDGTFGDAVEFPYRGVVREQAMDNGYASGKTMGASKNNDQGIEVV